MQLQFNKTTLRCLGNALQEVQNAEVTQEHRLSDGMPDIGRVLTTWGQVIIRGKQWQGNTVEVTGGVMLWALYAPENGTEPRSVESWIPFQMRWDLPGVQAEGPMRVVPFLRFADSRSLAARKLMLRAGIAVTVEAMYPMEVEVSVPGEMPEDVQLLQNTYPVRLAAEGGEKTFQIDEDLELTHSGDSVEKLLCLTAKPEVTEKKFLSDKIAFKGNLQLHLVYRNEVGQVQSRNCGMPFSQLVPLDQTYDPDAQVDIQMATTSLESSLEDQGKIRVKCGVVAQYLVTRRHLLNPVQDAYSPNREVQMETKILEVPVILDGVFLPDFPRENLVGTNGELALSGVYQILLRDEQDVLQGTSVRWEGKMPVAVDADCHLRVVPGSIGNMQAIPSVDGLTVNCSLQLSMRTDTMDLLPMVTALELGPVQAPDPARPSVILRCGGGMDLWTIAKNSGSTVSAIRLANGIEDDIAQDRYLLIPVL